MIAPLISIIKYISFVFKSCGRSSPIDFPLTQREILHLGRGVDREQISSSPPRSTSQTFSHCSQTHRLTKRAERSKIHASITVSQTVCVSLSEVGPACLWRVAHAFLMARLSSAASLSTNTNFLSSTLGGWIHLFGPAAAHLSLMMPRFVSSLAVFFCLFGFVLLLCGICCRHKYADTVSPLMWGERGRPGGARLPETLTEVKDGDGGRRRRRLLGLSLSEVHMFPWLQGSLSDRGRLLRSDNYRSDRKIN